MTGPDGLTYVLQREPGGTWAAYIRELVPNRAHPERPVIHGAQHPFAALKAARKWAGGLIGACQRAGVEMVGQPQTTTRLVYQPTRLNCGCTGTQVHAFRGAARDRWVDDTVLGCMPRIDAVMALDMDHGVLFRVPMPFPPWDPDDQTMPAIVERQPFTAVCHCTTTAPTGKWRRVLNASNVPTMGPIPPPFVELLGWPET